MSLILFSNKGNFILTKQLGEGATCKCYYGHKVTNDNDQNNNTNINKTEKNYFAIKIFEKSKVECFYKEKSLIEELSCKYYPKIYFSGKGNLFTYNLNMTAKQKLNKKSNSNSKDSEEVPLDNDLETLVSNSDISPIDNNINNNNYNNNPLNSSNLIYYMIMEYFLNGELFDYIKVGGYKGFPENISSQIFIKIVHSVGFLHSKSIVHCDIKPENILLDENFFPKLIDFGFSQKFKNIDDKLYNFIGTPRYCCNEAIQSYHNQCKSFNGIKNDLFSLGVFLFVITAGEFPFCSAENKDRRYSTIIKENYEKFWQPYKKYNYSKEFKDLINKLICFDENKRISINDILVHPWIKKYINKKEENDKNENIKEINNDYYEEDYYNWTNSEAKNELKLRKNFL